MANSISQASSGGTNITAGRDVEIEVAGDFVGGNKTVNTQSYIEKQVIVQGREITDIEQLPPEEGEPPYQGLSYFTESDAQRFFGRDAATAVLVSRLHTQDLLAVIGASGSGKSSLVRAGLIPVIKRNKKLLDGTEPPTGSWQVHTLLDDNLQLWPLYMALADKFALVQQRLSRTFTVDEKVRFFRDEPAACPETLDELWALFKEHLTHPKTAD